ncbi:MAG: hypothetical protein FWG42_02965 [Clostridiales bacterium]|nr:hypothetical protein [Clostridiales bacterium]
MTNRCFLLSLLVFSLMLCGCEYFAGVSAGKIIPPPGKASPYAGKWEVVEVFGQEKPEGDEAAQWTGGSVQFSEDAIVFGGQFWESPSYRIKRVDAEAYISTKNIAAQGVQAEGVKAGNADTADVITIFASGSYLGEFMILDELNMIFFVQNNELLLKKIADEADAQLRDVYSEAQGTDSNGGKTVSGVLIGLRAKAPQGYYTYRTLWIAASSEGVRSVLKSDHIFFPRMSGFWECVTEDVLDSGNWINMLNAHGAFTKGMAVQETDTESEPTSEGTQADEDEQPDVVQPSQAFNAIEYIGNDYVAVESVSDGIGKLHVLPVDSLPSPVRIRVADLLGGNGGSAYENARAEAILALKNEGVNVFVPDELGENFGLMREKGHWKLIGRVNYQSEEVSGHFDFDLKTIPPGKLIFFDNLALNWNRIKDRVPDALDAFTSPNQSIALVKTKNKIVVYAIGNEQLSVDSLGEIELAEDETIVMAEWATAVYVDSWERAFAAYGARER